MPYDYRKKLGQWINPAEQDLWAKLIDIKNVLETIEKQNLNRAQSEILQGCKEKLEDARVSIDSGWKAIPFSSLCTKKYKVFWGLVHRIDEDMMLLVQDEELLSKAIDVKTFFDLNIKERSTREEWLGGSGQKGKLIKAIEGLEKGNYSLESRHIIKEALRIVNERMDRTFWILSLNTLVSLYSSLFLALAAAAFWCLGYVSRLKAATSCDVGNLVMPIAFLGLMGAYISNLVTKKDFLFIKGPFWRFFLHHLVAKPVLSSVAAVFLLFLAKSRLVFSVNPIADPGTPAMTGVVSINVDPKDAGYVYAVLAVASGFSADKVLRGMIDRVLRKLEENAEKTKETKDGS